MHIYNYTYIYIYYVHLTRIAIRKTAIHLCHRVSHAASLEVQLVFLKVAAEKTRQDLFCQTSDVRVGGDFMGFQVSFEGFIRGFQCVF